MTREEAIKELSVEYLGDSERMIKAKKMAVKALKQEPRWIPVTERLPKEGEDVLVANSHGFISVGYTFESWDRALHWRVDCDDPEEGSYFNPIAWQPLPEPYKAESEEV